MKTTMLFLVLTLALVSAPLTAEAKKKRAAAGGEAAPATPPPNSFCALDCELKKGLEHVLCMESCELGQRSNLVQYSRVQCTGKCTEQKGITAPAMKLCQEECQKNYVVKAAEVTAACNKSCEKEKNPKKKEKCKRHCTPPAS